MDETRVRLSAHEINVLRFLSSHYQQSSDRLDINAIPGIEEIPDSERGDFLDRFCRLGFVKWASNASVKIQPVVVDAVYDLDHPPVVNQWSKLIQWWFSASWRAYLTAAVVVLPLLVQWIQMIQTVLSWIGVVQE